MPAVGRLLEKAGEKVKKGQVEGRSGEESSNFCNYKGLGLRKDGRRAENTCNFEKNWLTCSSKEMQRWFHSLYRME